MLWMLIQHHATSLHEYYVLFVFALQNFVTFALHMIAFLLHQLTFVLLE